MISISKRLSPDSSVHVLKCFSLFCLVLLASGCASAELTHRDVYPAPAKNFLYIHANVVVSADSESADLNRKILKELDRYNMKLTLSTQPHHERVLDKAATALLRIEEIDRRLETVEYRRRYGRTALTQMRGRKSRDVPVITLRAMLIDLEADKTVYQADYVAQGPWYADSATLVASVVHAFTRQLEQDGFIAVKADAGTNTN